MEERLPRKLAVILHADVVGYSRLAGEDEDYTHRRLKESLDLIANLVSDYHGRIVNTAGDALLAMFEAVVDAVSCAVAIQDDLAARNQDVPDNRKVLFRIGVNLGDVIEDGGDIYGDGVNVAARLETLAEAGGICISSIVHESLGNRVDVEFADAGVHEFKNIARKIRVYRWPAQKATVESMEPLIPTELKQNHTISIAKFENLSSDPELGYFCDGIVEDISAALGDIAQLTVISNHQSNGGVKASSDYQEAALYLLKGTIRKAGDRLRISAQLVERQSGVQRWADRFNHDTTDIFQVQDDVMRRIVIGIHTELGSGAYINQWQWGTESLEAWQLMAKGFREFQRQSPDSMIKTISFWEHALEIDPDYLAPVMGTGYCYSYMALVSDKDTAQLYIEKAQSAFDRSVTEAPNDVRTYSAKRGLEIARGNYDAAVAAAQIALDMEPNNAACRGTLAMGLMSADKPLDALSHAGKAALDMPDPPGWLTMTQSLSHYMLGDLMEAIRISRETIVRIPDFYPGPILTAAFASDLELTSEAAQMRKLVLEMDPQFSADLFVRSHGFKNVEHHKRLLKALISSGLPE